MNHNASSSNMLNGDGVADHSSVLIGDGVEIDPHYDDIDDHHNHKPHNPHAELLQTLPEQIHYGQMSRYEQPLRFEDDDVDNSNSHEHSHLLGSYSKPLAPPNGGNSGGIGRSKSEGGLLRRSADSMASIGSFLGHAAFLFQRNHDKPPSVRSQKRQRWNFIFGFLLFVTTTLLVGTVGTVVYYRRILPARQRAALDRAIRAQAAVDAQLLQQCRGITWQNACDALGTDAGARKRQRRRVQQQPNTPSWIQVGVNEDEGENVNEEDDSDTDDSLPPPTLLNAPSMEEKFLNSDDPTVTYDPTCLRIYRLKLMHNITFPYRSSQLLKAGGNHTMALLIQHGALRDAADYFCSFKNLMLQQTYRPVEDILIIAPHFQYEHDDYLHPQDAFWNSTKPWGDWRVGAESDPKCCGKTGQTVSSFTVLDRMLAILTNKQMYPNMNKISFLGHSAGGQMVQRYAVMSTLAALWDFEADIDIKFVIANPSSYTYLDNRRFKYRCGHCHCTLSNCTCNGECDTPPYMKLGVPTPHNSEWPCYRWNYDRWPYGLGSFSQTGKHGYRHIPYALRDGYVGVERALRVYRKLDVVYMVGQNDTCNDGLPTCDASCWKRTDYDEDEWPCFRNEMDTRCQAMLQGPCRRTRGYQYMNYLQQLYQHPTHVLYEVPGVGHDASAMFGSEIGMQVLFDHPV